MLIYKYFRIVILMNCVHIYGKITIHLCCVYLTLRVILGCRVRHHNALWSINRKSIYNYGLCSVPSAHAFNLRSHQCANVFLGKYSLGPNYKCMGDFMPTSLFQKWQLILLQTFICLLTRSAKVYV